MKVRLVWKLLAVNVALLMLVLILVWLSVDTLAASYFSELMERYHISPEETHAMFLEAVHRYLAWTVAGALALALLLSFLLTRRVLRPLSDVSRMTGQVAAGDYKARVQVRGTDEVSNLAQAFNRMADSLDQVERLRKRMVMDVAHELRTPLTNVRGYLEALGDGILPPEKATFNMLQAEVERLVKLVEDLLQLARADAARAFLRPEQVVLPLLVEQVLALHAANFRQKGIRVETRFGPGADRVYADSGKLCLALENLVDNGWRYAPTQGHFNIEAERVNGQIRVTFSNDGEGIPRQDLPFIFERFYRAEKSRSREHGGAGIGLSVVKEIIEAHRGGVGASQSEGLTKIWFTLPG